MKLLRHGIGALVVFVVLVTLIINVYTGLQTGYGFTDDNQQTYTFQDGHNNTGNIMEQFQNITLLKGIVSIQTNLAGMTSGNFIDLLGGLAAAGIGATQVIVGLVTAPFEIVHIITAYYWGTFPAAIIISLTLLVVVYAFFILLSAYLKKDV